MDKFAIIDVETTGGSFKRDRIIEIAIVIHDGSKELSRFETLINPEITIPSFITGLTGIRQEMVENAPYFYEVAKEIVLMTEDCIFVAHNVRFDYGFVRYEFERLGYTYSSKRLCTVKLAKQNLELPSYGMDQLIEHFGIEIEDRHRAMGDAAALSEIFPQLFAKEEDINIPKLLREDIKAHQLPDGISLETYKALPQDPGVYYMLNDEDYPVYIGKSNNIKKRIYQHFTSKKKAEVAFERLVKGFRYELTGSTLIAELKEAAEIKSYLPVLNRAQRNNKKHYFSYLEKSELGHEVVKYSEIKDADDGKHILRYHTTKKSASSYVHSLRRGLGLCSCIQKGILDKYPSCIHDQLNNCDKASNEDPEYYNEKFSELKHSYPKYPLDNGVIFIESSFYNQTDYILIEGGVYQGYGTLHQEEQSISGIEGFRDNLNYQEETLDVLRILKSYFFKRSGRIKKIKFPAGSFL